MINFTTFADRREFYKFWDSQDHTKHNTYDFVIRAMCVSIFNEETEDQCATRLMRSLPPIHSEKKWRNGGRTKYDTLLRSLDFLASTYHNYSGQCAHRAKYLGGVFASKLSTTVENEKIRILLKSLASKIAGATSQEAA